MKEIDRINVKTELYEFAESKISQYGDTGLDLTVVSLLEVTTELGLNIYGLDETLDLINSLQSSLAAMKAQSVN